MFFSFNTKGIFCLFTILLFSSHVKGVCDTIYYSFWNQFCIGERENKDNDICQPFMDVSVIHSFTQSPKTGDFFAIVTENGDPYDLNAVRSLWKFSMTLSDDSNTIEFSEPELLRSMTRDNRKEFLDVLTFSCDIDPILYGVSAASRGYQYLYKINENNGELNKLKGYKASSFDGRGLFYNIKEDVLYRTVGRRPFVPYKTYEIDPLNNYKSELIQTINSNQWGSEASGNIVFTSHFDAKHFIVATRTHGKMFIASLEDEYDNDFDGLDNRNIYGDNNIENEYITDMMCQDYSLRCEIKSLF